MACIPSSSAGGRWFNSQIRKCDRALAYAVCNLLNWSTQLNDLETITGVNIF